MTMPPTAAPAAQNPNDLSKPLYGASFGQAVSRYFKRYAHFSGRSSRSEYWWATLAMFLLSLVFAAITGAVSAGAYDETTGSYGAGFIIILVIGGLVSLALIIPSIAVTVRRLHDANLSGWFYLLYFIPTVGTIVVFVFTLLESKPEGARFDK